MISRAVPRNWALESAAWLKAGMARQITIVRSLGMGLDEQAVSKIGTWKFKPAERNGQPATVAMVVEVPFHLY